MYVNCKKHVDQHKIMRLSECIADEVMTMTNLVERKIPAHIEKQLRALGVIPPLEPEYKDRRFEPVDQWWKRGEECPH